MHRLHVHSVLLKSYQISWPLVQEICNNWLTNQRIMNKLVTIREVAMYDVIGGRATKLGLPKIRRFILLASPISV